MSRLLSAHDLCEGAFLALKHAEGILEDAAGMFERSRFATSLVLSTSAREELGRTKIILNALVSPPLTTSVESLKKACADHVKKLRHGATGSVVRVSVEEITSLRSAFEDPTAPGSIAVLERLEQAHKAAARRDAEDTHRRRLSAQYVEPLEPGGWNTPSQVSEAEAWHAYTITASDFADAVGGFFSDTAVAADSATWPEPPSFVAPRKLPPLGRA